MSERPCVCVEFLGLLSVVFGTGIYIYDSWVIFLQGFGLLCECDGGDVMAPIRHNDVFIQTLLNTLNAEAVLEFSRRLPLSIGVGIMWVWRSPGDTVGSLSHTHTPICTRWYAGFPGLISRNSLEL